jgi:hypothetical protein
MKVYQFADTTGPDALRLVELPEPKPAAGQVLVRVHAASLNYRDLLVSDGRYGKVPLPLVPLSDGAGELVAVGEGVKRWKTGDRVAGTFFQGWQTGPFRRELANTALGGALNGMLSEYVTLSADGVVAIPPHLGFEEAATLPCRPWFFGVTFLPTKPFSCSAPVGFPSSLCNSPRCTARGSLSPPAAMRNWRGPNRSARMKPSITVPPPIGKRKSSA